MNSNTLYNVLVKIAEAQLREQEVGDNDYYDTEGLLVCGVCNERRQYIEYCENPTEDNPDNKSPIILPKKCLCERRREMEERKREQYKADMERLKKLKDQSMIDERFKSASFDNFKVTTNNKKNYTISKKYADSFDKMLEKGQGLLMWGDVGTGKSYTAACIANSLMSRYVPVVMTSFVKILDILRQDVDGEISIINAINNAQLVIFDDFGAERSTDYALEKVYNIIDTRYRDGRPMILTTNLTMSQMQEEVNVRYSRIYDRIFEVCYPMQFTGKSWRKKTARDKFTEMENFINAEEGE